MIPVRTSRPFGRVSPRVSETDLARLIDRTIQMRVDAKREQGFAATNIGCDGRKRTTMFDGSGCQVDGEVCIATRQDGISACIEAPTQGLGLTSQSITFSAPVCTPVTGWYILDDEGYLYKIPTDLLTTVPYWPQAALPATTAYAFVRSGTWAALMCAAALTPPVDNDDGNSEWFVISVEGVPLYTVQRYDAAIGGLLTHLETVPGFTDSSGQTIVGTLDGRWSGVYRSKGTTTTITLSQSDVNAASLVAGEEYKALIYAATSGASSIAVNSLKGAKAIAGSATAPALPSPLVQIALGVATVAFGGTVTTASLGTTTPINLTLLRVLGSASSGKWYQKGLLQRDEDAPNPGARNVTLTLPAAGTNVVTGDVRIAFGYPLAYWVGGTGPSGSETPPFGLAGEATPAALAARDDYDMALVYTLGLGIEYAPYHLNLAGPDIVTPDASDILSTLDTIETRGDSPANLLVLPNNELAVSRPFSPGGTPIAPQRFDRYRVRPAPSVPVTVALSQATLGAWPVDPNEWVEWRTYQVNPWLLGATSFTLTTGSWTHGKPVACVLWQSIGAVDHWTLDVTAKLGQLQQPTGGTATIAFDGGGGAQAPGGGGYTPYLTILGTDLTVAYGWTFSIGADESALSPLTETTLLVPSTSTFRITLTVPLGPSGTTKRTLYRFAYDRQDLVNVNGDYESPWLAGGGSIGAVYDRMMVKLGEIGDNATTTYVDTTTALTYSGTRPPQPFIGPAGAGITMDRPNRVYALPPLNL